MAGKTAHFHILWARERIHEMDAALVALRRQAGHEAPRLLLNLKKRRDRFANELRTQVQESEIAWRRARARLERDWKKFETELHRHLAKAGQDLGLRQSAYARISGAQAKAWRATATALQDWKSKVLPARRHGIAGAIVQLKGEASHAQTRVKNLSKAGTTSWLAMRTALARSRRAFDRAHRQAHRAIRQAMR
jgi:hypothetical protein